MRGASFSSATRQVRPGVWRRTILLRGKDSCEGRIVIFSNSAGAPRCLTTIDFDHTHTALARPHSRNRVARDALPWLHCCGFIAVAALLWLRYCGYVAAADAALLWPNGEDGHAGAALLWLCRCGYTAMASCSTADTMPRQCPFAL